MKKNTNSHDIDIRKYDYLLYQDNNASNELRGICAEKNLKYLQNPLLVQVLNTFQVSQFLFLEMVHKKYQINYALSYKF